MYKYTDFTAVQCTTVTALFSKVTDLQCAVCGIHSVKTTLASREVLYNKVCGEQYTE